MSDFISTFTFCPVAPFFRVNALLRKWQRFTTDYNLIAFRLLLQGFTIVDVGDFYSPIDRATMDGAYTFDGLNWTATFGEDFLPQNDALATIVFEQFNDVARFNPLLFPAHWEESYATFLLIDPPPSNLQAGYYATAGRASCQMLQLEVAVSLGLCWNVTGRRVL